jgi:hypothetical protein
MEAAVEAGKHLSKSRSPLTVGVRQVLAAAEKARQRGGLMSGAQKRSDRKTRELIGRIRSGEIGGARRPRALPAGPSYAKGRDSSGETWKTAPQLVFLPLVCGDQIVEQHFHNIDIINYLLRMHPESVVPGGTSGVPAKRCTATSATI